MDEKHKEELKLVLKSILEAKNKMKLMNAKYLDTTDSEDKKKGLAQIRNFLEESKLISNPEILEQFENIDKSKDEWTKVFKIVDEQIEAFEKEINTEIEAIESVPKNNENKKEGEEQNVEVTDKGKVILRYKNILSNINNMLENLDKGMKSIENDINQLTKILETDYGMKVEKYIKEVEPKEEKIEKPVQPTPEIKKVVEKEKVQPTKMVEDDEDVQMAFDPKNIL